MIGYKSHGLFRTQTEPHKQGVAQDSEIETCSKFTEKKLGLVDPRRSATLGTSV